MDVSQNKFYSWKIVNDHVAIKHCDISVFKYGETGIPEEIKWFWDAADCNYPYKRNIVVIFLGKEYQSYVEISRNNRTHLRWFSDLSKQLNQLWITKDIFPMLRVEKISSCKYSLSFLDLGQIKNDANSSLDTTVEVVPDGASEGEKIKYLISFRIGAFFLDSNNWLSIKATSSFRA